MASSKDIPTHVVLPYLLETAPIAASILNKEAYAKDHLSQAYNKCASTLEGILVKKYVERYPGWDYMLDPMQRHGFRYQVPLNTYKYFKLARLQDILDVNVHDVDRVKKLASHVACNTLFTQDVYSRSVKDGHFGVFNVLLLLIDIVHDKVVQAESSVVEHEATKCLRTAIYHAMFELMHWLIQNQRYCRLVSSLTFKLLVRAKCPMFPNMHIASLVLRKVEDMLKQVKIPRGLFGPCYTFYGYDRYGLFTQR